MIGGQPDPPPPHTHPSFLQKYPIKMFEKNILCIVFQRSSNQDRLNSLAIMLTESEDTRKVDFKTIFEAFAEQKLRNM
jgi:hypothetical protein